MKLLPFPGCCTAGILTGFGGTDTAEYRYRPGKDYTEESFFEDVKAHLETAHRYNYAMVFATTNSEQKLANTVFPRIGFQQIEESAKKAHQEHNLLGWVFRLNPKEAVVPLVIPQNPFGKKKEEKEEEVAIADFELELMPQVREPVRVVPAAAWPARRPVPAGEVALDGVLEHQTFQQRVQNPIGVGEYLRLGARYRVITIESNRGGVESWCEIHPEDVGRVKPDFVGDPSLEVVLVGVNRPIEAGIRRFSVWEWEGLEGHQHAIRYFRIA